MKVELKGLEILFRSKLCYYLKKCNKICVRYFFQNFSVPMEVVHGYETQ